MHCFRFLLLRLLSLLLLGLLSFFVVGLDLVVHWCTCCLLLNLPSFFCCCACSLCSLLHLLLKFVVALALAVRCCACSRSGCTCSCFGSLGLSVVLWLLMSFSPWFACSHFDLLALAVARLLSLFVLSLALVVSCCACSRCSLLHLLSLLVWPWFAGSCHCS